MKFLQKYWFLILILIIAMIILYKQLSKPKTTSTNTNTSTNTGGNILQNIGSTINNTIGSVLPQTIKTNNFVYGDKIYANENSVNLYKVPNAQPANLVSQYGYGTINKDTYIGTFVQKSGIYSEILITNPAMHVFVLSNQIFSK